MKADEQLLMAEIRGKLTIGETPYVREIVHNIGMNEKRAAYICEKWARKGWYDYGVNVLAGWLTDEASNVLAEPLKSLTKTRSMKALSD